MTEVETDLLKKYDIELVSCDDIASELSEAIIAELSCDNPNSEKLAEIIKKSKDSAKNDKAR